MKRRILVVVLLFAVMGVLALVIFRPREPRYGGKPLSYWLPAFDRFSRAVATNKKLPYDAPPAVDAAEAMRQIGTNAFPELLQMLQEKDSALKLKVVALVQKQHLIKINFVHPGSRNAQASEALQLLDSLGVDLTPIVPDLVKIYDQHISLISISCTAGVLNHLGTAAKAAVPAIERGLTNADEQIRLGSIDAFCRMYSGGGEQVKVQTVLMRATNDVSPTVRQMASNLLSGMISFGIPSGAGIWFMPAFKDVNADLRLSRLQTISQYGRDHAQRVGPQVADLLHDPLPVLRQMACFTLRQLYLNNEEHPEPYTITALVETLKDPDPMVRSSAATALKELDPAAAAKAGVK